MNPAFEANTAKKVNASLYILGFREHGTTYIFDDWPVANLGPKPNGYEKICESGNYNSLGCSEQLPIVDQGELTKNMIGLESIARGKKAVTEKSKLASLIVLVSEATRMNAIRDRFIDMFNGDITWTVKEGKNVPIYPKYQPDINICRNWGGHTLG